MIFTSETEVDEALNYYSRVLLTWRLMRNGPRFLGNAASDRDLRLLPLFTISPEVFKCYHVHVRVGVHVEAHSSDAGARRAYAEGFPTVKSAARTVLMRNTAHA